MVSKFHCGQHARHDTDVHRELIHIIAATMQTDSYVELQVYRDISVFVPPCRWSLKQAVLMLREGQSINLLNPAPQAAMEHTEELNTECFH